MEAPWVAESWVCRGRRGGAAGPPPHSMSEDQRGTSTGTKASHPPPFNPCYSTSSPGTDSVPPERTCESFFFPKNYYSTGRNLHSNHFMSPEPLEGSTVTALSVF